MSEVDSQDSKNDKMPHKNLSVKENIEIICSNKPREGINSSALIEDLEKKRFETMLKTVENNPTAGSKTLLLTQSHDHYCVLNDFIKNTDKYDNFITREIESKEWVGSAFPKAAEFELGELDC